MGEKGNGGHIPTGGTRAVRTAGTGLGGSQMASAASSGGGLLAGLADDVKDHATDVGGAVVERTQEHREDD